MALRRCTNAAAADDVYRIDVASDDGRSTGAMFANLNGEIEVTPPPGPYVDAPGD